MRSRTTRPFVNLFKILNKGINLKPYSKLSKKLLYKAIYSIYKAASKRLVAEKEVPSML